MPQVDLEALVSLRGGSGRKIACETLADGGATEPEVPDADVPPDFPPESFCLSKDAELDWFDRNAFFERKESTKGNSNSPARNSNSNPSSHRFSLAFKSKAAIIGLPKTQKTNYCDTKRRNCKPPNIRLFPKRTESIGKSAEPSSPKVSCMGRVRSKRGRRRSTVTATETFKSTEREVTNGRPGFLFGFMGLFGSNRFCGGDSSVEIRETIEELTPRKSVTMRAREFQDAEPPGLGGTARFASGRRSWSAEEIDVARSD